MMKFALFLTIMLPLAMAWSRGGWNRYRWQRWYRWHKASPPPKPKTTTTTTATTTTTPAPTPVPCPEGFLQLPQIPDKCFYNSTAKTWDEAEAACQVFGPDVHLATLDTDEVSTLTTIQSSYSTDLFPN